ncbi:hypothetical protein DFJ73DRAFT_184427 [Zopfochytrium polystomum]|nr:hypothetical protein DFJ73DRAFT_184427 [Zopfochytrium polystomum]
MDSQPHLFQDIPPPYSDGVGLTWHPARGIVVTERREISAYLKKIHQTVVTQYIKHPYMVPGHSFHDSRQFSFRHSACLNEFPRGYVLLAVSRAEGKGVDKYISGHPSLSQYRSMKEFEPHIVWLTSDCTSMYKNCACVLCKKMPPTSQAMLVDINGQVRKLSPQVQSVPVPPSKSAPKQELQQQPFNPRNATKSEMVREVQASFVPKISSTAGTGPGKLLGNHQTSASASSQYPPYHQNATLRNLQPAKASSVGRSSQQTQKRDTPVNDTTQPGSECVVQSASASTSALPQKGTDSKWSSNVINHSHSHLHTKHSTAPKKEKHHSTAANKSLLGAVKELQVEGLLGYDSKKLYSANAKPAVKKEKQSRNQASATGNYLPSPESGRQKRLPSCEEPVLTCQPATGGATLPMKVKKPSQFLANESASGRKNFGTFRREGLLASNLEFLGETTNGPDIASNSTQKLPVLTTDVAKVEKSLISPLSEGSEPGGNSGRQIVSGGHEMLEIEETPTSDDGMLTKAEVIPPTKEIRAFACEQTPCLEHLNQSSPSSDEETTPGIFVDLSRKHVKNLSDRAKMIKERKRRNRQLQEDSLSNLSNGAGACTFTQNQGGSVDSKRRRVESSISGGNSMEDILEDILEVRIPPAAAFMENTISSLNVLVSGCCTCHPERF